MHDQCFADLQSAQPYGDHEYVVSSVYFDPDRQLVGQPILVEDLEGYVCDGVIIEQDGALIEVALDLGTWRDTPVAASTNEQV